MVPVLVSICGVVIIALAWAFGLSTGLFVVHVAYPLGFWLVFEGLALRMGLASLLAHPRALLMMVLAGAGFGLLLDFYMVHLTGVLNLIAVTGPGIALQMYLGWGLCLPAAYQSYRVFLHLLRRPATPGFAGQRGFPASSNLALGIAGGLLAGLPLFLKLWVGDVPEYLIVTSFIGFWLIAEHIHSRRNIRGLLSTFLAADPYPLLAMVLASLPFTFLWEGLNYFMGSWRYQNIFLLTPALAGVPLVVFFGYLCGYYVIFLSLYSAIRLRNESDLPIFSSPRGAQRSVAQDDEQRSLR